MTKAAVAGELPSLNALPFGGGRASRLPSAVMKRKTPTELRGEMLKRQTLADYTDESSVPVTSLTSNTDSSVLETKKPDTSKAPRYIDTQLPYSVTKNSTRNRLLLLKGKSKAVSDGNFCAPKVQCADAQVKNSSHDNVIASEGGKDKLNQANKSHRECSNVTFPSLTKLLSAGESLNGSAVDMDKAFKDVLSRPPEYGDRIDDDILQIPCSEFVLPGHKIPLDLSIKTNMRVQSSSSVNWFHRLINRGTLNDIARYQEKSLSCIAASTSTCQVTHSGSFHSWVHPQSTLPRSAISALTLAGGHTDFLLKRQQAWEDSFRSLYYMFRKNICRIFYVCTGQFVVMFTGSDGLKESKRDCYCASISQSTTHLRSLLKEHDISFAMPLCQSKVEEVTAEDLVELSEIAKYNLGQTRASATMTGIDNSPQSSLMITGNKNVHGLYEFLLNYRVSLTTLTGDDVPVLYSPVLFENAALSAPEVRCKEVKRVGYISDIKTELQGSSPDICYSIEISDACLPPWIVSDICNAMRSNGGDFEASFKTKSMSIGLNIGLETIKDQPVQQVTSVGDNQQQENGLSFGIPNTIVTPHLHSAYLDGLRYSGGSYTASISRAT